ncbi:MAG TPA: hypothetical protein VFW92_07545 [Candidatus Limnocylindrales bacterium]|nr:hypothetical protein [Candidatus Limnocylindrales bacterium]
MTVSATFQAIKNDFATIEGVLYQGATRPSPALVVTTHPRSRSSMTGFPGPDLAARGVDTLCFDNRFSNSPAGSDLDTIFEELALDVAAAVQHGRDLGYRRVVVTGHSAGGPTMAFYQHLATHGPAGLRPDLSLSGFAGFIDAAGQPRQLPAADGLVLRSSTVGTAASFLIRLDGSVIDEHSGRRDPRLDPYAPANGFDRAQGEAHYEAGFLQAYYRAQAARMQRLIEHAQAALEAAAAGDGPYTDDAFIEVPRTRANPTTVDLALATETAEAHPLYPGGSRVQIRDRRPLNSEQAANDRCTGAAIHRVRAMLSYRLVQVDPAAFDPLSPEPDGTGIDFLSSNSSTPTSLANLPCPLLILQGTADESNSVKLTSAELDWRAAGSPDKELAFIEGGMHSMLPVDPSYGDTRSVCADVFAAWVKARFA